MYYAGAVKSKDGMCWVENQSCSINNFPFRKTWGGGGQVAPGGQKRFFEYVQKMIEMKDAAGIGKKPLCFYNTGDGWKTIEKRKRIGEERLQVVDLEKVKIKPYYAEDGTRLA